MSPDAYRCADPQRAVYANTLILTLNYRKRSRRIIEHSAVSFAVPISAVLAKSPDRSNHLLKQNVGRDTAAEVFITNVTHRETDCNFERTIDVVDTNRRRKSPHRSVVESR